MAGNEFTTEQKQAIELRGKNLLISASAGTGKTTVLVERIIRMATDPDNPVDIDRMLIVTFTNAASEEMKGRIRNALFDELKKSPGNYRLRKQLVLLGQANISTIHSFCSEVIRSNYHLLDIDPGFSVCDAGQAEAFLEEAMSEILAEAYAEGSEAFSNLVDGYGSGRDDNSLTELLAGIYRKARNIPEYRDWITEKGSYFNETNIDFGMTRWGQLILMNSAEKVRGYIADIINLRILVGEDEYLAGYHKTLVEESLLLNKLLDVLAKGKWDDSRNAAFIAFGRLASAKKGASDHIKSIVKDTRDSYKSGIGKIQSMLSGTSDEILSNMMEIAPVIGKMTELLLELDISYSEIKNKNGVLDYNDLEHYALKCLETGAGDMYRDRFDEIFVDEYQDSNHIQEQIVNSVSGRRDNIKNVFMVGDIKQSIYRFRTADPGIFKNKYIRFSSDVADDEVKIDLFKNYRSRRPVLEFTNYVFSQIMSLEAGDADYSGNVLLKPGKEDYPEGNDNGYPVEIKLVCGDDKELFAAYENNNKKEAAVIGNEIIRIRNSGMLITDKRTGTERPVNFGDIAILNRSSNSVSADYIGQLKQMGIPVYSESNSDFFSEREIIIMTDFCRVLDNPRQDIPLVALMRSSIFNFTDKELTYIRCGTRYENFYDSLIKFNSNTALKNKIRQFLEVINKYRTDAVSRPLDRLIWDIMHETGFYYFNEKGDNPEIRQRNLRRLFEIAGSYEGGRETGLFGFVGYLDSLKKTGVSDTSVSSESGNTVTLMSIHKSKGLEFPVVFLSGCGKKFNKQDLSGNVIFHNEYGFGPEFIDSKKGYRLTTAAKNSIKIKKETEDMSEEMRVLYVALTRAREKLVITGYVKNLESAAKKWFIRGRRNNGKINSDKVLQASDFLAWIMSSVMNHQSGVTFIETPADSGEKIDSGGPHFNIQTISAKSIRNFIDYRTTYDDIQTGSSVSLSYEETKERFNWEYPYAHESIFHKKVSVTELKKLHDTQPGERDIFRMDFIPKPEFMSEDTLGAAGRGTLLHNIIAAVKHERIFEPGYIKKLCIRAGCDIEVLDEYADMITDFFKSFLGKRMLAAECENEKPFLLPIQTKLVYPDSAHLINDEHTTVIQGVIDSMIYENDGITIIDYKSDNVIFGNENEHAMRYKTQLDLYTTAVTRLTGKPVKEKYIYFFKLRKAVLLP